MKPYKSIFKESDDSLVVNNEREAEQTVDISNLIWGEVKEAHWEEAIAKCPSGWRLPTVQELYTAWDQQVPGFGRFNYWSLSTVPTKLKSSKAAWAVTFKNGGADYYDKGDYNHIRYVKKSN